LEGSQRNDRLLASGAARTAQRIKNIKRGAQTQQQQGVIVIIFFQNKESVLTIIKAVERLH
jgi:hypothetical protein